MQVLQQSYRPTTVGEASEHCYIACPMPDRSIVVTVEECSKCAHCAKITFTTVLCKHDEQGKANVAD
jgi:hypothetical protein